MKAKHDIFVSYSRKDSKIVLPIVDRLKAEGYRYWMDVSGIESGDIFKQDIFRTISIYSSQQSQHCCDFVDYK